MASETINLKGKAFAFGVGPIGKKRKFNGTVFSFAPEDKGKILKITEVRAGANSLSQSLLTQGSGYTFNGTSITLLNPGQTYIKVEFERDGTEEFNKAAENAPILRDIQAQLINNLGGGEVATVKNEQVKSLVTKSAIFKNPGEILAGFKNFGVTSKPSKDFVKSPMPVLLQEDAGDGSAAAVSPSATSFVKLLKKNMKSTNLSKVEICNGTIEDIQKSLTRNTPGLKPTARKKLLSTSFVPPTVSVKVLAKVEEAVSDREEGITPEDNIAKKQIEVAKARSDLFSGAGGLLGKLGDMLPQGGRSFANIQPNMLAKAQGITGSPDITKAISNIPEGVTIPAGQKNQVVEKLMKGKDSITGQTDFSTNMSQAVGKGKLITDVTPPIGKEEAAAPVAKTNWKGYLAPADYVFETIGSLDKLIDYFEGSVRVMGDGETAITQVVVDYCGDEFINAKDAAGLHKVSKDMNLEDEIYEENLGGKGATEASAAARKKLEGADSVKNGLQAHLVIKRDGTLQKGRPIDQVNGDNQAFGERFDKMIYVVFIAGSKNPVTPQQAATFDNIAAATYFTMLQCFIMGVYEIDPDYVAPEIDISATRTKYGKITGGMIGTDDPGGKTRKELGLVKSPEMVKTVPTKVSEFQSVSPTKIAKEYEKIDETTGLKKPVNIDEATAEMKTTLEGIKSGNIDVQGNLDAAKIKGRGEASKIIGDKNANALFGKLDGMSGSFDGLVKDLDVNKFDGLTSKISNVFKR